MSDAWQPHPVPRAPEPRPPLDELAELHGIQRSYVGADGVEHRAGEEAVLAALRAMGLHVDGPADIADALGATRRAGAGRIVEPVLVHWIGRLRPIGIRLPRDVHPRDGWLVLELEDGGIHRERLITALARPTGSELVDGRRMDGYQLRIGASPTVDLPAGYHRLTIVAPGIEARALLIAAPHCPRPERGWGAFLPLHALRTDSDWGIGTYRDLGDLRAWVSERGGSVVGTLPLYPMQLEGSVEPSPYLPLTRLGWNEAHVDPRGLPELEIAPEAADLLGSTRFLESVAAAHRSVLVDHAEVLANVRRALEPMAEALFATPSARRDQLAAFVAGRPDVAAYARFRAAAERLGPDWRRWGAPPGRIPDGALDESGEAAVRYHLYAQWVAEQQLAAAAGHDGAGAPPGPAAPGPGDVGRSHRAGPAVGATYSSLRTSGRDGRLFLDLPLGVDPQGFDPWWEPDAFVTGVHGGAPPDPFFAGGQDWSIPPLHPQRIREQEYRYPIAVLRQAMRHAAVVRLDHVMALHRLYWVPEGMDARHGVYVRYHDEELRAIVALEAHRAEASVVGEDLGTVPGEVRQGMERDGMLRSWVLQFQTSSADPLPAVDDRSMASWGTHDLPRFAAYWEGADIDEREGRGHLSRDEAQSERVERSRWRRALLRALGHDSRGDTISAGQAAAALRGCVEHLASSPAPLVLVDLEELWLERRPQNRPGTGVEAANWRRRAARTTAEMQADDRVVDALRALDRLRRGTVEATPRDAGGGGSDPAPAEGAGDAGRPEDASGPVGPGDRGGAGADPADGTRPTVRVLSALPPEP